MGAIRRRDAVTEIASAIVGRSRRLEQGGSRIPLTGVGRRPGVEKQENRAGIHPRISMILTYCEVLGA